MRFKIDWANLIVGRKFTVFALFYLVFEGNFQVQAPGGLYMEGRFNGRFFALQVWGAYIWRGVFSEFYGIQKSVTHVQSCCFANLALLLFCRSRCCRHCGWLSSLMNLRTCNGFNPYLGLTFDVTTYALHITHIRDSDHARHRAVWQIR